MEFAISAIHLKVNSQFNNKIVTIDQLLAFCSENKCSDLYIKVGEQPYINRYGQIIVIPSIPFRIQEWESWSKLAISSERNSTYVREKMLDLTYELLIPETSEFYSRHKLFRYRVSVGYSNNKNIATFRMISPDLPSFKTINYPEAVKEVLKRSFQNKTGIILFVGATGSGKTTTLASCINDFSNAGEPLDNSMIITLEDPVEYLYNNTNSMRIVQKELGKDFKSFPKGIKQSLREHPTHILCGEIRDEEGISTCIEASRTGHKVMTTFHTDDVSGTIARLYNYLSNNSDNIMYDLIANIDLIVCQRLSSNGNKFKLDTQYMYFTEEIKKYLQTVIMEKKNIPMAITNALKTVLCFFFAG